ncbi:MAG: VanZ family protein [Duncaniella sp.]|nr:VanZ family protein [Duncaniella sp.]
MRRLLFFPGYQLTAAVVIVILYLTLLPQPLGEEDFPLFDGADKVVHFLMFGGLTGTFIFDRWRLGKTLSIHGALLTALCSTLLGGIIEWLQHIMALGRTGNDIYDALANTLGAFTAIPICIWLHWVHIIVKNRT